MTQERSDVGLMCRVQLKPAYRENMRKLHVIQRQAHVTWGLHKMGWWGVLYQENPRAFPNFKPWMDAMRGNSIPFGAVVGMPFDFGDPGPGFTVRRVITRHSDQHYVEYDVPSGVWSFCCSLSNCRGHLEAFIDFLEPITRACDYCWHLHAADQAVPTPGSYTWGDWRGFVGKHLTHLPKIRG